MSDALLSALSNERPDPDVFQELKAELRTASILKGGRVVFKIAGNKYRVILAIGYQRQFARVRFVGTHTQYDQVNAETV